MAKTKTTNEKEDNCEVHNYEEKRFGLIAKECIGDVVDIGCANKQLEPYVMKVAKSYVGVDNLADDKSDKPDFVASAYFLPFSDHRFDTAILSETLEHLGNPFQALQEAIRVTNERIIISVPNPYYISAILDKKSSHVCSYTTNNMKEIAKQLNLKYIKRISTRWLYSPHYIYIFDRRKQNG